MFRVVEVPKHRQAAADVYDDLVRDQTGAVYRYVVGMVGNRADAEDITQDVFLSAFERLDQLRNLTRSRGWLFAIATNAARKHLRRRRRWRWLPLAGADGQVSSAHPTACHDKVAVEQAMAALSEDDRAILLLIGQQGFTAAEAAEVLGITVAATHKRWQRACARFRLALGGPEL